MCEDRKISLDIPQKRTITTPEGIHMWSRFIRIQNAVYKSLTKQELPSGNRQFNTLNWTGADSGIHDHKGSVKTIIDGISLDLLIEGSTYDYRRGKEVNLSIFGKFTSRDHKEGLLNIYLHTSSAGDFGGYEAYWLDFLKDKYRLEQYSNLKGVTINVPEIQEEKYHLNQYVTYSTDLHSDIYLTRVIDKLPNIWSLRRTALG